MMSDEESEVYYWTLAQGIIDEAHRQRKIKLEVNYELLDVDQITFHKDGYIIFKARKGE